MLLPLGFSVFAQTQLHGFQKTEKNSNAKLSGKVNSLHQAKKNSFQSTMHDFTTLSIKNTKDDAIEPFTTINGHWGTFYDVETGQETIYQYTVESYYENYATYYTTVTLSLFDDDLNVSSTFSFELPTHTNGFYIEYERNANYFAVYAHHFVGGVSFDNLMNSILLVDDSGEIVHTLSNTTGIVSMKNNKLLTVNFDDYNEDYYVYFLDDVTFEEDFSITIPQEMTINLGGAALTVTEFEGESYAVIAYYEDKYTYDWENLTENNHLNLDFYNYDYQLVKEVDIPLIYPAPEDFGVFPMPAFGSFLSQFDITQDVFNSDEKWEFLMPFFVDTWSAGSWYNFYVINEDGEYLDSHEEIISDYFYVNDLEGFDTQIAFIVGGDDQDQQLQFFNIESWEVDFTFDAIYNGDRLSVYMGRKAQGNTFDYLIGLADNEIVGEIYYGVIKHYDRTGTETGKIRLPLGTDGPSDFIAALSNETLNPHTFDTDAAMDYMYGKATPEGTYVCFSKAEAEEPFFVISPDPDGRSTSTYGFFYDEATNMPKTYYQMFESFTLSPKTDFYALPFFTSEDLTYIINATASGNGTITPSEEVTVAHGDNQTFTFTPDQGYEISRVIVDDVDVDVSGSYTFENVTEAHTIHVVFEEKVGVDSYETTQIKIYPNPAQDKININSNVGINVVRIFDITGRTMYETCDVNRSDMSIDISNFAKGVYIIHIDEHTMKIVKQ